MDGGELFPLNANALSCAYIGNLFRALLVSDGPGLGGKTKAVGEQSERVKVEYDIRISYQKKTKKKQNIRKRKKKISNPCAQKRTDRTREEERRQLGDFVFLHSSRDTATGVTASVSSYLFCS